MCRESKGLINVADKLGRTPLLVGLMAGAGLEAVKELLHQERFYCNLSLVTLNCRVKLSITFVNHCKGESDPLTSIGEKFRLTGAKPNHINFCVV